MSKTIEQACRKRLSGHAEPASTYFRPPSVQAGLTDPATTEPGRVYLRPPSVQAGLKVIAPMKLLIIARAFVFHGGVEVADRLEQAERDEGGNGGFRHGIRRGN